MDFLKDRVGVEVECGHSSFIGIDLLKFQVASYSGLDKIDVGVYIVTTKSFQKRMKKEVGLKWEVSLTFEKVTRYLPHFKSAIQVPIFVSWNFLSSSRKNRLQVGFAKVGYTVYNQSSELFSS